MEIENKTEVIKPEENNLISGLVDRILVNISKYIKKRRLHKNIVKNCLLGCIAGFFIILRNRLTAYHSKQITR